ncbi:MAG TPA: PIN domain-containing protein [Ardenticatenaceae bacterium]|jgi:predicted nucleic acid-binding protein
MRVLFDTNVVLDVLLKREPWLQESLALWQANDERRITGYVTATTVTDVFYIARRLAGLEIARTATRVCLEAFDICAVERQTLEAAMAFAGADFEDNLQIACAILMGLDAIVTRDQEGLRNSLVPVLSPSDLLAQLP